MCVFEGERVKTFLQEINLLFLWIFCLHKNKKWSKIDSKGCSGKEELGGFVSG